jgi:cytidylate kinase
LFNGPVVAIDGPAGAGKSTVAKELARELGFRYLDTGAMYRALALKALRMGLSVDDPNASEPLLADTVVEFSMANVQTILLDGEDVGPQIRTPAVGEAASALSTHPPVRRWLVERQRAIIAEGNVILEGRDATTVIAPNATLKIFLTASLEERAKRRLLEFQQKGLGEEFEDVRVQIENRDHRDITRTESPLRVAKDAQVVETGARTVAAIVGDIKARLGVALGRTPDGL